MSRQHIPDVLETGFFSGATFSRRENLYRIRYEARSDEALSKYLDNDAARLRADFSIHFPTGVEVRRKSWKVLRTYADRGDYR